MEYTQLVDTLRREGEVLGEVRIVDVDVPTCPDWTLPDLIHHVGTVHRWQRAQLQAPDPNRLVKLPRLERPEQHDLAGWYDQGLFDLLNTLAESGPDRLTPTWSGPQPARFWARRAAHETAVHRWDAQASTSTTPLPLEPPQAVDLLDELFDVVIARKFDPKSWEGSPISIHLHATDDRPLGPTAPVDGGEWLLRLGADGFEVTRAHAKGDVAVRGPVSSLALMMVGRIPPARLEVLGEASVLDRWFRSVQY